MAKGFVWFHNRSDKPTEAAAFYEALLGWSSADGPPGMTMLAQGAQPPFAGVGAGAGEKGSAGWIPYVEVPDVDAATDKARSLGARVLEEKTRGPAGEFAIVADPGGAAVALWQKG